MNDDRRVLTVTDYADGDPLHRQENDPNPKGQTMTPNSRSVTIVAGLLACEPAMSSRELLDFAIQIAATAVIPAILDAPDSVDKTTAANDLADAARESLANQLHRILAKEGGR